MAKKRRVSPRERQSEYRDAKLIVIATEGRYTEASYFKAIKPDSDKTVIVVTLPAHDNKSSPQADAVIAIRFETSDLMATAAELLVYGTAVKLRQKGK